MNVQKPFVLDLVVPIHGNLPLNKIFFKSLRENTLHPFRLIVVDNHSPDASGEFFQNQHGNGFDVVVIKNSKNQCYPVSMNQGLMASKAPIIGLLNNDIVFSPGWDSPLVNAIQRGVTDCASPIGLEHLPDGRLEEFLFSRWRIILKRQYSSDEEENLQTKINSMYGSLSTVGKWIQERYRGVCFPGIMGHCHLISRELLTRIGELDVQMEGADWDLYLRIAKMVKEGKMETLPMIFGDSYVHHFIRATKRNKSIREPRICSHPPHMKVEEKWSLAEISEYWPFPSQRPGYRKSFPERIRKVFSRLSARITISGKDSIQLSKKVLGESDIGLKY